MSGYSSTFLKEELNLTNTPFPTSSSTRSMTIFPWSTVNRHAALPRQERRNHTRNPHQPYFSFCPSVSRSFALLTSIFLLSDGATSTSVTLHPSQTENTLAHSLVDPVLAIKLINTDPPIRHAPLPRLSNDSREHLGLRAIKHRDRLGRLLHSA